MQQARVLPNPFFRFHLTVDTLGFGCILPTAGWIGDFHSSERVPTGYTEKGAVVLSKTYTRYRIEERFKPTISCIVFLNAAAPILPNFPLIMFYLKFAVY